MAGTQILALTGFAVVSSITPGPNNMMLMASGANYGMRRTLPHMLGVVIGFAIMIAFVGIGITGLLRAWPPAFSVMKVMSAAYLLWLAWKIGTAPVVGAGTATREGRPITFVQAALFQWINPQAWTLALTATAIFVEAGSVSAVAVVAAIFGIVNLPVVGIWAVMGQYLQRWLNNPTAHRVFNGTMAALLVASLAIAF